MKILLILIVSCITNIRALDEFTLDEYLDGTFSSLKWNGNWISETDFIYRKNDDFYRVTASDLSETVFITADVLADYKGASITVSPDLKFILIRYDVTSVFRHSTTAKYVTYDLEGKKKGVDIENSANLQYCSWGKDNSIIYVYENNVYYLATATTETGDKISVTTDGKKGIIYNGVPDWIYEEEVLFSGSAIWKSTENKFAFAQFDDTDVEEFDYVLYENSERPQYTHIQQLRYPKPGTTNPKFSVKVFDPLTPNVIKDIEIILQTSSVDYVLHGISWKNNDDMLVLITNRIQNEGNLQHCISSSGTCEIIKEYTQEGGWLIPNLPKFNADGTKRVEIHASGNFPHIHKAEELLSDEIQLSQGDMSVTGVLGWRNDIVYYEGSLEGSYTQQHVYSVNSTTKVIVCITCDFKVDDIPCKHASASFSKDFSYMALICQGPMPDFVQIRLSTETDGLPWIENAELKTALATKKSINIKDVQVTLSENVIANVRLLVPTDSVYANIYPMIVNVYGGPDSNQISDAYSSGLENYLVTSKKYIYAYVDGRGSGRQGYENMFSVYKKLGTLEIQDQISAILGLPSAEKSLIDFNRVGIWGWSYGGFSTAHVLAADTENLYKFGISVAPVTNFMYYDSIYTERYMGDTTENAEGYKATDLSLKVNGFINKTFLLIHGNADDNVHYQQSMLFARALELADIPFRQMSYPEENHSLGGVSKHLYHTIDSFWTENIGKVLPPTNSANTIYILPLTFSCVLFIGLKELIFFSHLT